MLNFYLWIVVQIVLESLPVSSSGHICLLEKLLGSSAIGDTSVINTALYKKISYSLHAPTAVILIIFFRYQWWFLLRNIFSHPYFALRIGMAVVLANAITIVLYGLLQIMPFACHNFLPIGFAITLVLLSTLYWLPQDRRCRSFMTTAAVIGFAQGCALLPGISRFASTYVVGCWMGLSCKRSFEFSFAVQFPLIAGASVYGLVTLCPSFRQVLFSLPVLSTVVCAAFVAYLLLYFCFTMVQRGTFYRFAWYIVVPLLLSMWV